MKTYPISLLFFILLLLPGLREADAAPSPSFTLTMTPTSITFPDQDPNFFPSTQANTTVSVSITTSSLQKKKPWSLHAQSSGDLNSSTGSSIPISNISWTAVKDVGDAQTFFYTGNMTKTSPGTLVASGQGSDLNDLGTLTFFIQNLWTYATGNYSQTTDFTLTSP